MKSVAQLPNSYAYHLFVHEKDIEAMYHMNVSLDQLKACIMTYIKPAAYSFKQNGKTIYTKKKQFIENINNCENSYEVINYVRNTIKKAFNTEAHQRKAVRK